MLDPYLGGEFFADPCGPESETLGATRSLFYLLHIFWQDQMVGMPDDCVENRTG